MEGCERGAKRNDQVKACSSVNSWGVCRKMFTVLIYATSQLGLDYSYNKISVKSSYEISTKSKQKRIPLAQKTSNCL